MDDYYLVASHISPLSSTPPSSFVVKTARQDAPLATGVHDKDLPVEHATCSSVLTTDTTGSILLRVIHGGLIVELVSLSTSVPPLRIVFPAIVLPNPSLFLSEEEDSREIKLHLVLATDICSLFRLTIPIERLKLWQDQVENIWCREYGIRSLPPSYVEQSAVHVLGTYSVAITLPNGDLLRLESEFMSYDEHQEEWTESVFHHGSFLSTLTAFLPLHSSTPYASDIISMASHTWPTDNVNLWTLSRDRTLRLWKTKLGCVASKALPPSPFMVDLAVTASSGGKYPLLDAEQQNLVKVFSLPSTARDGVDYYILVFIPTPSSNTGGFFCLLDTTYDRFEEVGKFTCPLHTAHCHLQDFTIQRNELYALWDRQGQSMVEKIEINLRDMDGILPSAWKTSHYACEPELTPAYMEEQLISSGSLSEKFLEAIMKPGVFSSLTLRTALDKYVDACLSIPGPPPPQLLNTYATLCENIAAVVGCTVTLNRDPQTGGFQYANYWTALKRDWEGFVARCREVERSARWPLAISAYDGKLIVVERERVGALVIEDIPIYLRRSLERDIPLHIQYELLAILWALRSKLGPAVLTDMESRVVDILHQETAFSFAEVLQDTANRVRFIDALDEGSQSWFAGRLQSIADMDTATRNALDSIGGFDLAIKHEPTDNELLHLLPMSEWIRAQSAAYITTTIEARYDLCLCLIISLFFQADALPMWDASLLAEVFAVFRGLAMLRFVGSQPAEGKSPQNPMTGKADDVVTQMRNMNVSSNKIQTVSKSSLMHLLVSSHPVDGIAAVAHNFLDATGLLQSISPAHATKHEILFCDRVRKLGFPDASRILLSWLPRTPAATFLRAQTLLELSRADDASQLLEKLAGAFGVSNLTLEDSDALTSVLPLGHPIDSQWSFYVFAADLFRNKFVHHEILFSRLALQVAPPGAETASLWNTVVKGCTDLGLYDDAYASIMSIPFEKQKRECASQLAIRMCEEKAVEKLMNFNFAGIAGEVEAALAFKARNADPRVKPSYSRILYTWFIRRGDYRSASLTMYQRALKLQDVITDATSFIAFAEDYLEALSVAVNALNLVDEKNSWVLMPVVSDVSRRRQKLSKHIPESKYLTSKHDAEIIHLTDMEYDCVLLRAQIDIIKQDPSILSSPEYRLPPALIVMRLAKANQYDQAMAIAQSLKVDMTDVFNHLTNQCLRLSRNPGSVLQEDTSGWLLTDNAASWQGTPSDRGWRYLQQALKRYDSAENDYRYAKASLETILSMGGSLSSPPWLIDILEKYQPEYLIRISLRYENIADAVNYTYALLLKSDKQLGREAITKESSASWLPYALIDQVLIAADALMNPPTNLSQLRAAINARVKRMQKFSQNVS